MIGDVVPLDAIVAVGFGVAHVLVDGALLLDGDPAKPRRRRAGERGERWPNFRREVTSWRIAGRSYLTLYRVERYLEHRAKSGAPVVGRIEAVVHGPLYGSTWERVEPGRWVVTEENKGFA